MYRILLADEENILLEGLRSMMEKNFGVECEIVTAKTGREVVELAESFCPDIILVDIRMPGISGLQAIKEIRRFNQNVIFIVATSCDKFRYAREAIHLGVMEYLIKPVNRKEILEVFAKAMYQVDETRKKRSDDLKLRERLETILPVIESCYVQNLIQNEFRQDQNKYRMALNIPEDYAYMIVVEFERREKAGLPDGALGEDAVYMELREIAREFFPCLAGPIMGRRVALLVPYGKSRMDYEEHMRVLTGTRAMLHKLESRMDCRFRCGIGMLQPVEHVQVSYVQALRAFGEEEQPMELETNSVVSRAKAYIRENFQKDISLEEVSHIVNISPYYLSRLFKHEEGTNFIEYLTGIRMENARNLLKNPCCSIKEVCMQSGYSNPNYFSRIFKKYEGVTPSEFRERLG
jgi:two-component system response regulator YesN